MKRTLIVVLTLFLVMLFTNKSYSIINDSEEIINIQKDNLNISDFIKESEQYTKENMPELNVNDLLSSAITGSVDTGKITRLAFKLMGEEFKNSISTILSIIVVVVIHGILKAIGDGLKNTGVSKVAFYVQYILIVTIIMTNFADIIKMVRESIYNLVSFINMLIPILITLLITTGKITTAGIIQPLILFLTTFIGNFIVEIIIPIILVSTALGIVSQISDKVELDRLSGFLKSGTVWTLGVILTLFVGVSSLESTLTSQVDGVTAKTTKAAVSSFVPVVGKILGDAVETVMGCSIILKNALGVVGVIVIISICIVPIIKLVIMMAMYYLCSALCQPIADSKVTKLLSHIGDTYKMLLAVMSSISVMLIICLTVIIKISGNTT